MIVKSFELSKIKLDVSFFLFYGENQGYKDEIIKNKFRIRYKENTFNYNENEILTNKENFFNSVLSKSFFENRKLVVINRATDKILEIIDELIEKKIKDLTVILNANILEKKSKIRSLFEKNKETICVPFYQDSNQTLSMTKR